MFVEVIYYSTLMLGEFDLVSPARWSSPMSLHGGRRLRRGRITGDVLAGHGGAGPASVVDLLQVPAAAVPGVLQRAPGQRCGRPARLGRLGQQPGPVRGQTKVGVGAPKPSRVRTASCREVA